LPTIVNAPVPAASGLASSTAGRSPRTGRPGGRGAGVGGRFDRSDIAANQRLFLFMTGRVRQLDHFHREALGLDDSFC
jgi:hypothetical protein